MSWGQLRHVGTTRGGVGIAQDLAADQMQKGATGEPVGKVLGNALVTPSVTRTVERVSHVKATVNAIGATARYVPSDLYKSARHDGLVTAAANSVIHSSKQRIVSCKARRATMQSTMHIERQTQL